MKAAITSSPLLGVNTTFSSRGALEHLPEEEDPVVLGVLIFPEVSQCCPLENSQGLSVNLSAP